MKPRNLFFGIFFLGLTGVTSAALLHVDDDNATGVEDGSAHHPFDSLQEAVVQAADGDRIRLAAGSYAVSNLLIAERLTLLGGYPGASSTDYAAGGIGDFVTRDIARYDSHLIGTAAGPVLRLEAPGANGSRIDGLFRLSSFALTSLETAEPAAFDAVGGRVDIPRVEVLGTGDVYRAQLRLVDPSVFTFELSGLSKRD